MDFRLWSGTEKTRVNDPPIILNINPSNSFKIFIHPLLFNAQKSNNRNGTEKEEQNSRKSE